MRSQGRRGSRQGSPAGSQYHRRVRPTLLLTVLVACGGPAAPAPQPATVLPVDTPPPSPPAVVPPAIVTPAPPAPPIDPQLSPTCVLRGHFPVGAEPIALRLTAEGPPFAMVRLDGGEVRFTRIPRGTLPDLGFALVDADVRAAAAAPGAPAAHLVAVALPRDVPVYAQQLFRMGEGMVVPKPGAPLVVSDVAPQSMVATLPNQGLHVVIVHGGDIRREVLCTMVGLEPLSPPVDARWGLRNARVVSRARLAHAPPLVLALEAAPAPDQTVRLEVTPPTEGPVEVLETKGTRVSVRVDVGNAWAFGWTDRSDLSFPFAVSGADWPVAARPREPLRPLPAGALRCDHPVTLEARVGGETRTVGTASAGAPIVVVSTDGPSSRIELPTADLVLAPGAELRAAAASLAGCAK